MVCNVSLFELLLLLTFVSFLIRMVFLMCLEFPSAVMIGSIEPSLFSLDHPGYTTVEIRVIVFGIFLWHCFTPASIWTCYFYLIPCSSNFFNCSKCLISTKIDNTSMCKALRYAY